jgi:hypothetical protein
VKTNRKESQVLAGIIAYLQTRPDVFFWRQNTSAGIAPSGQFMRSNMRGVCDIIGVQAPAGVMIGIEVKREHGGGLSPDQVLFRDNLLDHGAVHCLARSVEDVVAVLGPPLVRIAKHKRERIVPR